jgi:hypothetical protein
MSETPDILVKLRPSSVQKISGSKVNIEPLFERPSSQANGFGSVGEPEWFAVRISDGGDTPWDAAHARLADQLGVD